MKIGFDIDDTICNTRHTAVRFYNERFQKNLTQDDVDQICKAVQIYSAYGLDFATGRNAWMELKFSIFEACEPFHAASEIVNKLVHDGHEIFYITAREADTKEASIAWLKQHNFPFKAENFYIGMQDHEKIDIAKQLSLDLFFDDKPHVLDTFADSTIRVVLHDMCYNRDSTHPRILNWSEINSFLR